MDLVDGFIFLAVGTVAYISYIIAANEQYREEKARYENENHKIINIDLREQQTRVFTKHNNTIKANEVKR